MSKYPDIEALVNKASKEEDTHIVQIYAEIENLGFKHNLPYKRKLESKQVGVHRKNRDGAMVSGREAMCILDRWIASGSPQICSRMRQHSRTPLTKLMKRLSSCDAPPMSVFEIYKLGDVQVSSVARSHWNQAIGAVEEGLV